MEKPSLSDAREMTPSRSIVQVICGSGSPCKLNLIIRNLTSRKRFDWAPEFQCRITILFDLFPRPTRRSIMIMLTSVGSGYETSVVIVTVIPYIESNPRKNTATPLKILANVVY